MTQGAGTKYLFETSFAAEDIAYRQSFHSPEEMEVAKASSYAQGFQEAQQDFEARNHAQLLRLEEKFADLFAAQEVLHRTLHHWVSRLCQEAFKHAFPVYAQKARFDEIEALITQAMSQAKLEKSFTVRIAPQEGEGLGDKLSKWKDQGIEIHLEEDANMGPTDCQISWADSGLERMEAAIYDEMVRIFGSMMSYETMEMPLQGTSQDSLRQDEKVQHTQEGETS